MRVSGLVAVLVAVSSLCLPAQSNSASSTEPAAGAAASAYVPVLKYDSKRDGAADIQAAITEAQRTGKRIILDVGGDWCPWCHVLERFLEKHPEIVDLRDKNFTTVAESVNFRCIETKIWAKSL